LLIDILNYAPIFKEVPISFLFLSLLKFWKYYLLYDSGFCDGNFASAPRYQLLGLVAKIPYFQTFK
jgi:hypothetical protein